MQLKIAFNSSRQDRNASRTYNTLVTFLAENMFRLDEGAFIPEWAFEEAINFKNKLRKPRKSDVRA